MIRGIIWTHIQSGWNHSGPSEQICFRGPLFCKPVTGQGLFCCFLQQTGSNTNYNQPNTLARHETLSIVYLKAVALHTNLSVNQVYALTSKYINTVTPEGEFNLGCQL